MHTTIKLAGQMFSSLSIEPIKGGGVRIQAGPAPTITDSVWMDLTQDQCGALLFAIEQAAEAAQIAADRQAAQDLAA